jgi:hypothetical protein
MESTIRISAESAGAPKGGFVGALVGGTEPGISQVIEVDLRDATGGDIAVNLPLIAEAYRRAFAPDDDGVTIEPGGIVIDSPFTPSWTGEPEHSGSQRGPSQGGTAEPDDEAPAITGTIDFIEGGYRLSGDVTREQVVDLLNDLDAAARESAEGLY